LNSSRSEKACFVGRESGIAMRGLLGTGETGDLDAARQAATAAPAAVRGVAGKRQAIPKPAAGAIGPPPGEIGP